jgi:hypothetical protein
VAVHPGAAGPPPATASRKTNVPLPLRRRGRVQIKTDRGTGSECLMKQSVRPHDAVHFVKLLATHSNGLTDLLRRRDVHAADLVTTPRRAPNADRGWIPSTPWVSVSRRIGHLRSRSGEIRTGRDSVVILSRRLAARGELSGRGEPTMAAPFLEWRR